MFINVYYNYGQNNNNKVCVDSFQLLKPSQTFSRVHGNSGVTDVRCHGDDVYSCGRNGRYCQFSVANDNQLQLISSNKVSLVDSGTTS